MLSSISANGLSELLLRLVNLIYFDNLKHTIVGFSILLMFLTETIQEGLHTADERLSKKYEMLVRGTVVLMFYCFHVQKSQLL